MIIKFSRILGIIGVILAVPLCLFIMKEAGYASIPEPGLESIGYANNIILVMSAYLAASLAGLTGSLLVRIKTTLAGLLMLGAGVVMTALVIYVYTYICLIWPFTIPPILLTFAGVFVLIEKKPVVAT